MKVVNFFGGPGCGKSTTAAGLFSYLKMAGVNVELVTEVAKDLTWDGSMKVLAFQNLVFAQQAWRFHRVSEHVDVVVTDSPILLSSIYGTDMPECFHQMVRFEHQKHQSINFLLQRSKPYSTVGRNQTEAEAREIDQRVAELIWQVGGDPVKLITGDGSAPYIAFAEVMRHLEK
jgi:nicotinamide riboside kinase